MSFPKILAILAVLLFGTIAIVAVFKEDRSSAEVLPQIAAPVEIRLDRTIQAVTPVIKPQRPIAKVASPKIPAQSAQPPQPSPVAPATAPTKQATTTSDNLPDANRINELFNKDSKFPLVETISYKSRVSWLKGRPAWLSDYASHYQTSRHFIARSLHNKPDYFKQDLAEGDKFNVLRKDKKTQFHLLIDTSRCKMWFYAIDTGTNERTLLKTYRVGLGRVDSAKASGLLTPIGKYSLGNKIAIYKPKMMGYHNGERVEMISVFGSRWIPFDKENGPCTAPAKGFGIHGVPWVASATGERVQDTASIGKYQSDGCIRLATEDIEELFSIIITKPTTVELVKDFHDAQL